MNRSVPIGEVRRVGDHALLAGVADPPAARTLSRLIKASERPGLREVIGGVATVLVLCDDPADVEGALPWLVDLADVVRSRPGDEVGEESNLVQIGCAFDGPDLAEAAELASCTPDDVIEGLTARPLTVDVTGFSPGFAYLSGLPPLLQDIPRRSRPRASVPPGSVALANGYAAVYPFASPGGWQLVGRTNERLFRTDAFPYARLAPGDRVQFTLEADATSPHTVPPANRMAPSDWVPPSGAVPVFEVEKAGLRTALQDGGRRGLAAIGVPGAGPADPASFQLANRLVGNDDDAGALEITARGPDLRCLADTYLAVVGGSWHAELDHRPLAVGQVVPVRAGEHCALGMASGGLRAYVAIAGGLVGPAVLGSIATDQLCGLGPGELSRGSRLWAMPMRVPLGDHLGSEYRHTAHDAAAMLRVVPGPHHEWFDHGALDAFARCRYIVGTASNRVGLRLQAADGRSPVGLHPLGRELDSQGTVTGAVQIPPDGDPVILLPDHATLGGYPVLAVVASADHGMLGQCAPGTVVQFLPIDHGQAVAAWREGRRTLRRAVLGHYPVAVE